MIGMVWARAKEIKLSKKIAAPISRVNVLCANKLAVNSERQAKKRKKKRVRAIEAEKIMSNGYTFCKGNNSCSGSIESVKMNKLKKEISSACVFSNKKKILISMTTAIRGREAIRIIAA